MVFYNQILSSVKKNNFMCVYVLLYNNLVKFLIDLILLINVLFVHYPDHMDQVMEDL